MRKYFLSVATIIALSSSILFSSCIGSFNLFRKVLSWNQTIDSKFANEIVFIAFWIVPVYEVCFLADILVLNSIEFWSGDNPIEAGIKKEVQGKDGIYIVETLENGYNIQNKDGEEMSLVYDKESNTWSVTSKEETRKLIKFEDDNNVTVYLPNGTEKNVELSEQGLMAFRQTAFQASYLASK